MKISLGLLILAKSELNLLIDFLEIFLLDPYYHSININSV